MTKNNLTNEDLKKVSGGYGEDTDTCIYCWLTKPSGMMISSMCDNSPDKKHNFVPTWSIPEEILKEHKII